MEKKVVMPETLTAENGAKAALIGEFCETITTRCLECSVDDADGGDDDCDACGGTGSYTTQVYVSWTTIKEIYKRAVELLGEPIEIDDPEGE
jgi:hypothetical protein